MRYWAGYLEIRLKGQERPRGHPDLHQRPLRWTPQARGCQAGANGTQKRVGTQKLTTINRKLTSLGRLCKLSGYPNPPAHPKVKAIMRSLSDAP